MVVVAYKPQEVEMSSCGKFRKIIFVPRKQTTMKVASFVTPLALLSHSGIGQAVCAGQSLAIGSPTTLPNDLTRCQLSSVVFQSLQEPQVGSAYREDYRQNL